MSTKTSERGRGLVASGAIWPIGIVALLAMNMSIVGVTVFYATSDPSVAAEPNYYEKAVKWDQVASQARLNERLGWHIELAVERAAGGTLIARIADASGRPLENAEVAVEAFHNARSGERRQLVLVERSAGTYACGLGADRPGRWRLRLAVHKEQQIFTSESDCEVSEALIDGSV